MWLLYAGVSCVSTALSNIFSKSALETVDPKLLGWFRMFLGMFVVLPIAFYSGEMPSFDKEFCLALAVSAPLNVLSIIWIMRSMKLSDISLVVPLLCLLPGGVMVVSMLINNEVPTVQGGLGVLVTIVGTYMLSIGKGGGVFAPFKALITEKGPRYMLGVVTIWSFTSSMDKIGIIHSSPIAWTASLYIVIFVGLTPIAFKHIVGLAKNPIPVKAVLGVGLFTGIADMAQFAAFALAPLAYVAAIRQSSSLLTVVLGVIVFKEVGFQSRIAGATVMMIGVSIISFM